MIDVAQIRKDFPILERTVHEKPLVYLDNAATAQRPQSVIEATSRFYTAHNANVHRGVHTLSDESTELFEAARKNIASWLNAEPNECIYTSGTTESINLVTYSFAEQLLQPGDEILISLMEHHANIVPWQMVAEKTGAVIKVIPIHDDGSLDMEAYASLLTSKVKFVAVTAVSNVLGTVNPIDKIIEMAHANKSYVVIDGAQALSHLKLDVKALDIDFLALSAHKAFGPTGFGILYAKADLLETMRPYRGGGEMIKWVSFDKTEYAEPPYRFEAGTPNIAGAVGFDAALDYLRGLDFDGMQSYEQTLIEQFMKRAADIEGMQLIGTAEHKIPIFSFVLDGVHANDIGVLMDVHGVALRTGHHCAMPLIEHYGHAATARASFAVYNTEAELDYFFEALNKVITMVRS